MSYLVMRRSFVCRWCVRDLLRQGGSDVRSQSRFQSTEAHETKLRQKRIGKVYVDGRNKWAASNILAPRQQSESTGPRVVKDNQDAASSGRPAGRIRRRLVRKSAVREGNSKGDELIPSTPSAPLGAPKKVEPISKPVPIPSNKPHFPMRSYEHFNWYWETFPPTKEEAIRANKFFTDNPNPPKLLSSAARFMQVPESDVPEVAFVGRSNVGKSSLLNAIVETSVKDLLARTSARPGFTKTMNFYGVGPGMGVTQETGSNGRGKIIGHGGLVIVDMPGYGEGSLLQWGVEIMKYIQSRKQLRRVFVLIDAEHGIKDKDRSLLASLRLAGVSHQVILSKMDKVYIPDAKKITHFISKKAFRLKSKGSEQALREKMEKIKSETNPPVGGGALGEMLACSSELLLDGRMLGIHHVRYAILKAVGLEGKKRSAKVVGQAVRSEDG